MIPLSSPIPLRKTSAWPVYYESATIPQVYGSITLTPIRYDKAGLWYVIADHPIAGVDAVTVAGLPVDGFVLRNDQDATGKSIALLELRKPALEVAITATVRGKLDSVTGALITNPADWLYDVLAVVCGIPVAYTDLENFRRDTAGIEIGGMIRGDTSSVRGQISAVLNSIGAVWSGGMPGIAALFPIASRPAWAPIAWVSDALRMSQISSEARNTDLITALSITFQKDWATEKLHSAVSFQSSTLADYGRRELALEAPWLRNKSAAATIGARLLAQWSRPRWRSSWTTWGPESVLLAPGDWASVSHPYLPASGEYMIQNAETTVLEQTARLSVEIAIGAVPIISQVQSSVIG